MFPNGTIDYQTGHMSAMSVCCSYYKHNFVVWNRDKNRKEIVRDRKETTEFSWSRCSTENPCS